MPFGTSRPASRRGRPPRRPRGRRQSRTGVAELPGVATIHCYSCGYDYPSPDDDQAAVDATPTEPIIVWGYPGRTQADAAELFAKHATERAVAGYEPVSQSWADGRPGLGRVFALGVHANSIRPEGYLTVTYRRASATPPASGDELDKIRRLGELRAAGLVTEEEFLAKKAELLARL